MGFWGLGVFGFLGFWVLGFWGFGVLGFRVEGLGASRTQSRPLFPFLGFRLPYNSALLNHEGSPFIPKLLLGLVFGSRVQGLGHTMGWSA